MELKTKEVKFMIHFNCNKLGDPKTKQTTLVLWPYILWFSPCQSMYMVLNLNAMLLHFAQHLVNQMITYSKTNNYWKLFCCAVRKARSGRCWRWSLFQMDLAISLTSVILFFLEIFVLNITIPFFLLDHIICDLMQRLFIFRRISVWLSVFTFVL